MTTGSVKSGPIDRYLTSQLFGGMGIDRTVQRQCRYDIREALYIRVLLALDSSAFGAVDHMLQTMRQLTGVHNTP